MFSCEVKEDLDIKWIKVEGRIDSLSAPQLHREMNQLIGAGDRTLVADLSDTNYISSAGLRVFMDAFKRLKQVEGEIYFYRIATPVRTVLEMSNLTEIFTLVASREEIEALLHGGRSSLPVVSREMDGISIDFLKREAAAGELLDFGSPDKISSSQYNESDVVTVYSDQIQFGTGLATLGERYDEYKDLFGEAMTVQGNFFFYPAVNRPAVDFMLCSQGGTKFAYKYLHGFGFTGDYRYILSFEKMDGFVSLNRLVDVFLKISPAKLLGIVLLAESRGFWGMHLKRVPLVENRPANGKEIFSQENFAQWVNFPVEPGEIDHIIVAAGLIVREKDKASAKVQKLLGEFKNFHLHAGVFGKELLGRRIESFEHELIRVTTELPVYKVQHVLGQSFFSRGMAGIIELRG